MMSNSTTCPGGTPACEPTAAAAATFLQRAREQYALLKIGVLSLLVLACALPFSLNLVDPDLWGHVQYAQDWMAAGEMPRTATHTYTAEGHPWVNHENAAELTFAWGVEYLGIHWMLVLKCLLGLAIVAIAAATAQRHGVPELSAWALMVIVSANLQAFFPMRPQLFSFALCTAALVCLDRAFVHWEESKRVNFSWLAPLPLIFAAWVNSHGGFVAGLGIVGVVLLGRMGELAWSRRGGPSEVSRGIVSGGSQRVEQTQAVGSVDPSADLGMTGSGFWRTQFGLAAVGLACLAATLANPYGLELHRWFWHSWAGAPPEITEWAAPLPGKPVFWPLVTLAAVTVACLAATRKRRDWTQIVILALVAWQASQHLRHIAFFALLVAFWLPVHWHSAIQRLRPDPQRRLPVMLLSRRMSMAMGAAMIVIISLQSYALSLRLSDFPVLRSQYPVDALQYMVDHRLGGKTVAAFNWAQYAIAAMGDDIQVQFDGRFDTCYPQEVIDLHFDWLLGDTGPRDRSPTSGPIDGTRVLEEGSPDLVLVDRRYPTTKAVMEAAARKENPAWTLLYSDSVAELWGRRSRYDDPNSPHYLPPADRQFDVKLLEASWQWPALPDRSLWEAGRGELASR